MIFHPVFYFILDPIFQFLAFTSVMVRKRGKELISINLLFARHTQNKNFNLKSIWKQFWLNYMSPPESDFRLPLLSQTHLTPRSNSVWWCDLHVGSLWGGEGTIIYANFDFHPIPWNYPKWHYFQQIFQSYRRNM